LAILIVVISILFTRLLHDAISSNVRSGVASGVSAFSWMIFVPFSLLFGWVSNEFSVFSGGWLIVALAAISCVILIRVALDKEFKTARAQELVVAEQKA
ncbi:MAG: MFS transporter, partial [Patescibacteria group bacterium]